MRLPGSHRHGVLVGSVTPPQTLDETGSGHTATVQVLLTLLLLHLQSKARAQDALRTLEKHNAKLLTRKTQCQTDYKKNTMPN
jgi:hypothetical protein